MLFETGPSWVRTLVFLALGGCGSAGSPAGSPALGPSSSQSQPHNSVKADVVAQRPRLANEPAQAEEPAALLALGTSALDVAAGGVISFIEPARTRGTSPTVRFDVRDSDGSKSALVQAPMEPEQQVRYDAKQPGYASIHRCTRPSSLDALPNAWQIADLCEIIHVHVQDDGRSSQLRDRHLMSKIGLPIELRPYRSTATLQVGEELPVRLYQKGVPMPEQRVFATGEQGEKLEATTNRKGVATLEISAPGRWVIESELPDDALPSGRAKVRLVFEVRG